MLSLEHNTPISELNCAPLSDVNWSDTLNLLIHPWKKASAQCHTLMPETSWASAQRVVWSTIVNSKCSPHRRRQKGKPGLHGQMQTFFSVPGWAKDQCVHASLFSPMHTTDSFLHTFNKATQNGHKKASVSLLLPNAQSCEQNICSVNLDPRPHYIRGPVTIYCLPVHLERCDAQGWNNFPLQ
jgi:hypothetical protein